MHVVEDNFKIFKSRAQETSRVDQSKEEHSIRDPFERDRDRIMYSKAFRRLSGKTQVFLADKDDHTRNRLTHTLEVSQIARTIAKALGLNETLTEAIALGHDIGHTPFGHVGERMLHRIMSGCYAVKGFEGVQKKEGVGGFKHNWQSVKVATVLDDGENLNLTKETLWGMLNHSGKQYKTCEHKIKDGTCCFRVDKYDVGRVCEKENGADLSYYKELIIWKNQNNEAIKLKEFLEDNQAWTIEAYIVAMADEIAQRHHDIEDAIEYKILGGEGLKAKLEEILGPCNKQDSEYAMQDRVKGNDKWKEVIGDNEKNWKSIKDCKEGQKEKFINSLSKYIVNLLTSDVIYNTAYKLQCIIEKYELTEEKEFNDIRVLINGEVKDFKTLFSPKMEEYDKKLGKFLKNRILNSYEAQKMDGVGQYIIRQLFLAYITNPQQLPNSQLPYLFNKYYQIEHKDQWGQKLQEHGYWNDYEWNIGEMRDTLQKLHSGQPNENYQVALLRTICDYIAGMTDKHAIEKHRQLYNIEYK